jgi:hypothetical protein
MKRLVVLFVIFFPLFSFATSNRVEDLFIWKVSEELKLTVKQEGQFSAMVKDFNQRRSDLNQKIEQALASLKTVNNETNKSEAKKKLSDYKSLLSQYQKLALSEVDKAEAVLGTEKAARYFVIKADLTAQLKNALSEKDKK